MKNYIIYLLLLNFLFSCNIKKVKKSKNKNLESQLVELKNDFNKLEFHYDTNDRLIKIYLPDRKLEIFFFDDDINKIMKLNFGNAENFLVRRMEFNSQGQLKIYSFYHRDGDFDEQIDIVEKGEIKSIKIFNYLPNPVDRYTLTSLLNINEKTRDTFDFFFYEKKLWGYKLRTDLKVFTLGEPDIDSLELVYDEIKNINELSFYTPEDDKYMIEFKKGTEKILINSSKILTNSNFVVGGYYTHFNTKRKPFAPTAYKLILCYGDLFERIKYYKKDYSISKNYKSKMINNKYLTDLIIESGYFKLKGNRLVRDKTGE